MPNWRRGISKSNRKHADLAWSCTSFCHSLNTKTNFQESTYLIFLTEVSMVCNLRMNTFRKSLPSLKCRGQCYKGNWAQKNKNYLSVTFSQREAIIVTSAIICSTYCSVLNNRPLLIIIRGDNQCIKTWLFAKQCPSL